MRELVAWIAGLLVVSLTGCAGAPQDRPGFMWVSLGPPLDTFEEHQLDCQGGKDDTLTMPPAHDERGFLACMADRGWRRTPGDEVVSEHVVPRASVQSHVNIRTRPSTESPVLDRPAAGRSADLLDEVGSWYRVRLDDGSEGFVSSRWTQRRD